MRLISDAKFHIRMGYYTWADCSNRFDHVHTGPSAIWIRAKDFCLPCHPADCLAGSNQRGRIAVRAADFYPTTD